MVKILVGLIGFQFLFISCTGLVERRQAQGSDTSDFIEDLRNYYFATNDSIVFYLSQMDTSNAIQHNKELFLDVRKWYKMNEPMLLAFDYANYTKLNGPNLLKVEIEDFTDIKRMKPKSLQVVEEVLFDEEPIDNQTLHSALMLLKARFPFIKKNHIIVKQRDYHFLQMIRDAVVNIATKGITGFDSPMLANSLQEAIYNYQSIEHILSIYEEAFQDHQLFETWQSEIALTIQDLSEQDFDTFDRYSFIKNHTNRQLELINLTEKDWGITLHKSRPLNPNAANLFSGDFFNVKMFSPRGAPGLSQRMISLGKKLFNDPKLSKNGDMSCASCHLESKAFSDGLVKAVGNDGKELQRNTPALPYAVYQRTFFYDGRGDGLEGQIVSVMNNEKEFHMDLEKMASTVSANELYIEQFDDLYGGDISNKNIRNAIANYIRSLAPFDSKFDRNMQGKEESLSEEEILGFNLFMGKAACATCHFAPVFNGTIPPKFGESEFENLGVTKTNDFENPQLDDDPGMYYPYEVEERRYFFKTPTVRNAELSAPYMHNGAYENMEQLMTFYNLGGGAGMGLNVEYQTLPPDPLELSEREIKAVIAFMRTLTDKRFEQFQTVNSVAGSSR